jgi:two-component system response regulator FixJ
MNDQAAATLILVDDDAAVLSSLKFAFQVEGFEVRAYPDAESLLEVADFPDSGCMVLDYRLPGLDGLELFTRIRELGVMLPAVLITTPTASVRARAAAAGVTLVEKPLLTSTLLDTVRRILAPSAQNNP